MTIGDAIGADAFTRLEQVKAAVDPEGRFRSGHTFATATAAAGDAAVAA